MTSMAMEAIAIVLATQYSHQENHPVGKQKAIQSKVYSKALTPTVMLPATGTYRGGAIEMVASHPPCWPLYPA